MNSTEYINTRKQCFQNYRANAAGLSEYMQLDFNSGFDTGYQVAKEELAAKSSLVAKDERPAAEFKNDLKYYFVSFFGTRKSCSSQFGNSILVFRKMNMTEISERISKDCGFETPAVILNLRELSKEEFEMLNPEASHQQ